MAERPSIPIDRASLVLLPHSQEPLHLVLVLGAMGGQLLVLLLLFLAGPLQVALEALADLALRRETLDR